MVYWPVDKEISFKDISIFSSGELNILVNFDRRHYEEHFFEIILNLGQLFRRSFKDISFNSSGRPFVQCFQTNLFVQLRLWALCGTLL